MVERELLRDCGEQCLYVLGGLRRGLEEQKAGLSRIGFSLGSLYRTLRTITRDEIQLVSSQSNDNVFVRLALQLLDPCLGFIQRRLKYHSAQYVSLWMAKRHEEERWRIRRVYSLCNIVDYNSTVGVTVVHGRQRLVAFLTSGIPFHCSQHQHIVSGGRRGEELIEVYVRCSRTRSQT